MSKTEMWNPDRFIKWGEDDIVENGIYYVKVRVKENKRIPLLTLDFKKFQSLVFPVGTFKTVATGRELIESNAKILEVYWGYIFDTFGKIFKSYVEYFYEKRKNAKNKFEELLYKTIMNSTYGKFGQNKFGLKIKKEGKTWIFEDQYLGYRGFANVVWAIQVTSEARIYMYKIMNELYKKGVKIYYTDTDSIHTDRPIPESKLIGISKTGLGKLKLEGVFDKGTYIAEKEYVLGNYEKIVCKGIKPQNMIEYLEKGETEIMRPIRFREALRLGKAANVWIRIRKQKRDIEPKRIIIKNGDTQPIYIDEDLEFF